MKLQLYNPIAYSLISVLALLLLVGCSGDETSISSGGGSIDTRNCSINITDGDENDQGNASTCPSDSGNTTTTTTITNPVPEEGEE